MESDPGSAQGKTNLYVVVLRDGEIKEVGVTHGSDYPDIDMRIVLMVEAVKRFPPLPQWWEKSSLYLEFNLEFPEALKEPDRPCHAWPNPAGPTSGG